MVSFQAFFFLSRLSFKSILFESDKRKNYFENMKLILQWNQIEVAKNEIFTGEESFRPAELCELLELALVENKPDFVKLCY